ncbi:Fumble family protein [Trichomonas vaginalis G3]|uniref:Fumble family protein n=1 Tax=Trichomonas vaginalis (strain ATCC PRA-98 / G3) TaxID=412133 RepID=A2G9G7_TRIV3|nr:pantothenate kinase protein [Trichomonas vaginalis G3]EAX86200.1 Fumble family protein [Trichomonas vaginalis G3]KAI5537163.1 pantothenate kinase protein [Trichomonas vaginalis G3]|eukprot:XP_001299130.1 Fumble family protein [Trichomonas vaginalis G3]
MLGVDLGGTVTKICYVGENGERKFFLVPTKMEELEDFFRVDEQNNLYVPKINKKIVRWGITGCGSVRCKEFFEKINPKPVYLDELTIQTYGALKLLKEENLLHFFGGNKIINEPCLLISLGTGVSFTVSETDKPVKHAGGSSLGGGTLMGLANLLLGMNDFDELLGLAANGDPNTLDLLISDIYGQNYGSTLKSNVCASSFAKASMNHNNPASKEDIAASLVCTICYAIAGQAAAIARAEKVKTLVFVGGFLSTKGHIPEALERAVTLFDPDLSIVIPENHQFVGSIGCAMKVAES